MAVDAYPPFGTPIDDEWFQSLDELAHDMTLIPEAVKNDMGVYRDEHIGFVKLLAQHGFDAGFGHDSDHRTFSGRKGEPLVVPLVIGIAANVSTGVAAAAVKLYLAKMTDHDVDLKVIHRRQDGVKRSKDVFRAKGPGPEVARLYAEFEEGTDG